MVNAYQLILQNCRSYFRKSKSSKKFGHSRDLNIDLISKYITLSGKLVKVLLKKDYLDIWNGKVVV